MGIAIGGAGAAFGATPGRDPRFRPESVSRRRFSTSLSPAEGRAGGAAGGEAGAEAAGVGAAAGADAAPGARRPRLPGQIRENVREDVVRGQRRRGRRELGGVDSHRPRADVRGVEGVPHGAHEILVVEGAREDVEGADLLRVGLAVGASIAAHHQEDGRGRGAALLPDLADDLGARQPGQHSGEQDDVELARSESLETGLAVVGLGQGVPEGREQGTNTLDVAWLVFDQKNFLGHGLKPIVAENPIKSRRSTDWPEPRVLI